jgi:hypothetical protein
MVLINVHGVEREREHCVRCALARKTMGGLLDAFGEEEHLTSPALYHFLSLCLAKINTQQNEFRTQLR